MASPRAAHVRRCCSRRVGNGACCVAISLLLQFAGSFTYPGEDGPIATLRIKAIRDGIEDVELFRKGGVVVGGGGFLNEHHDLITQLATNFTDYREDPVLLERLRREVARRLVARNIA